MIAPYSSSLRPPSCAQTAAFSPTHWGAGLTVLLLGIILMAAGCTRGYESEASAGDLEIILRSDRYPLRLGENEFTVSVTGPGRKPVTDAGVYARYYLPALSGRTPMEFNTEARLKGREYAFTARIPVEGAWNIDITVMRPAKPMLTATFSIDSR